MPSDRYLHHVTLTTGDARRSPRSDVADDLMPMLHELVNGARDGGAVLPGLPGLTIRILSESSQCVALTVEHDGGLPILTMGIAMHARCGARQWAILHGAVLGLPLATRGLPQPPDPWLAVLLHPGAVLLTPETLGALADMERCLAWAWIESRPS